jgi:tetratricopeptide (TPR) repeat protein
MKLMSYRVTRALAVCALVASIAVGAQASALSASQDKDKKDKAPQISEGEQKALQKVNAAPDAAARLQAAAEYVKKYPKSAERAKVVTFVAHEANKVEDINQKIAQLEGLLTVFKEPTDADVINPMLIDAYTKAQRFDDAFRVASASLARNPNDVAVLSQMAIFGIDEARKGNAKYAQQAIQFATKAVEVIEAGKKPDSFDDARWQEYQTRVLPQLYQALGLVSLMMRNTAEAKTRLEKAAAASPNDAATFMLLGEVYNSEYEKLREQYQTMNAGPLREDKLKEIQAKIDQMVDMYARAVALSEGKPEMQKLHDQVMESLTVFYKFRHNNSTTGMQELINKHKKP